MPSAPSTTTDTYTWDSSGGLPLLLADATNTYLYGLGSSPYAQINRDTGRITYRHADQLGSTRTTGDTTGDTTGTWTYDTYGNTTTHTGNTTTPFRYAGQYRDSVTGLYYLRARSYDPATGQFLTPDPLTTLTRTPYAYTGGNPRQHADPTGLIDGAPCTWWLLSCGGLDEDITGSTTITTVNFGRGATGGLTDTIANRISPGASCTIDNTSLQARTSQALGFTAAMLPGSLTTGRATATNRAIGFADDAVGSAYQGMWSGGGHAIRHLRDEGLIANKGSLASQVSEFQQLTSPILRSPAKTFDWKLGTTMTRVFAGEAGGRQVVVFVAKEGPYQGRVLSAVVPDAGKLARWGLL